MTEASKKNRVYSANELCNIIKACNKYGVANIKVSGIEVNFMNQGTDSPQAEMTWTPQKRVTKDSTPAVIKLNEQDAADLVELEIAQQAIDDPIGYEQDVIDSFIQGEDADEINGYSGAQ